MTTQNGQQVGGHSPNGEIKDSLVLGETSQGIEIHATLLRLTRFVAVFEIYNPALVLRTSEVLTTFKIVVRDRTIYSGRAVVCSLVNAGLMTVCEVTLNENSWLDVAFALEMIGNGKLRDEFQSFLREWQKLYKILPEYKVIVADMQTFLADLRIWLDQVELGIRSTPANDRLRLEQDVAEELAAPIIPCVDILFEKFEAIAQNLDEDLRPAHCNYMRRQLHPFVLSAPFAYRAFHKPLGYAGDYEMVNMIARNGYEGGSLFAKMVNTWFLRQPPAQAHRNRISYLAQLLVQETSRVAAAGRSARILDLACGPAQEIQAFLNDSPVSGKTHVTLLDFNQETLHYVHDTLGEIKHRNSRETLIECVKKSVHQILKESGRTVQQSPAQQYDFVCCAGLFDYLSDQVCHKLLDIMYEWLTPGGLLIATNVEPSNPLRNGMDHLLDWHLIYRTGPQLQKLAPAKAIAEATSIRSDSTGVNVFLEVRKPGHA